MSKCFARLALVEGEFHLKIKMQEGFPELDDPDLVGAPPIVLESASDCEADEATEPEWGKWTTYVFVRLAD